MSVRPEYHQKRIAPFKHFWQCDNDDWLKKRETEWSVLEKNGLSKLKSSEKKLCKRFFLFGELDEYCPPVTLFTLIPFSRSSEVSEFFNSNFMSNRERERIFNDYIYIGSGYGSGMPWLRDSMRLFCQTILGDKYKKMEFNDGPRAIDIAAEPTIWCMNYIYHATQLLCGDSEYNGSVECVGYFVSALNHATKPKWRARIKMDQFLETIDRAVGDENASDIVKEFSQELYDKKDKIISAWKKNE